MSRIRATGNKDTEIAALRIFKQAGITGWRRHAPLPGKPDFVFPRSKVAVFVDGCFWHFCPKHGRRPTSNVDYWNTKLERNRKRDRLISKTLRLRGWRVIRFWEHDLRTTAYVTRRMRKLIEGRSV